MSTKGDLVLAALRKLGVASDATLTDVEPQSVEDAVSDLEMMMAEWYQDGAGIVTGYVFSSDDNPPATGDDHGMRSSAVRAVVHNLAVTIAPDYSIEPSPKLITTARNGKELLYKYSALNKAKATGRMCYPNRMPVGSGNRGATLSNINFYHRREPKDADCSTPPDEG